MSFKPIATIFLALAAASMPLHAADTWLLDGNFDPSCAGTGSFHAAALDRAARQRGPEDRLYAVRGDRVVPLAWEAEPAPGPGTTGDAAAAMPPADQLAWMRDHAAGAAALHWLTAADGLVDSRGVLAQLARHAATVIPLNIYLPDAPRGAAVETARPGIRFLGLDCGTSAEPAGGDVLDGVREIAAARLGLSPAALDPDTSFFSLGADEMTVYEINAEAVDRNGVQGLVVELGFDTARSLSQAIEVAKELAQDVKMRSLPGENQVVEQTVFYATNRQRHPEADDLEERYSGERNAARKLNYGTARVSIPASHRRGLLEGPFLGIKLFEDPQSHIILQSLDSLSEDGFYRGIAETLSRSSGGDWDQHAVVFVHGFNVPFAEAVVRTAQVAYDIGFTGAPILFSWPSDGSLLGYMSDREDATWSIGYLRAFLDRTLAELQGKKIHLIAHSMGNQVLIGALQQMQLAQPRSGLFETIILAAPDFDAELFADQIAPLVRDVSDRWTVYTSDKDAALEISLEVNSNPRLGQPVTPIADFDVIDATGIEVSPWSVPEFHSYYATKQQVINDIQQAISGVGAAGRGLKRKTRDGVVYYSMK